MFKYSKIRDKIYPTGLLSRYLDLPNDLVDINREEFDIYSGATPPPEGKQRKKHAYPFEFEDIPALTIEESRAIHIRSLSIKRREVVAGGVIIDGVEISTDEKSMNVMSRKVTESVINGLIGVNWKKKDGTFEYYLIQDFKQVFKIVANFEEACFARESELTNEINTHDDMSLLDINSGWPINVFSVK
jgi:hypothetical protein